MDKTNRLILFPCPFCGGKAEIISMSEKFTVSCGTGGCMANISYCSDKQSAVKAWNKRASDWIPCSERMPDEDSYKWAVGITSTGRCIAFQEHNAYENDTGGISVPTYLAHGSEITHWMPIPEPPGGDEE